MRKYTGKYPNNIREVSGTFAPGIALVKTNNGGAYYIAARDVPDHMMPKLGVDVFEYKFTRAQPMTFTYDTVFGDATVRFHRMLDGYALPFAEYPRKLLGREVNTDHECLQAVLRRAFIHDMAKQGVLPRFQESV